MHMCIYMYMYTYAASSFTISLSFPYASALYTYFPRMQTGWCLGQHNVSCLSSPHFGASRLRGSTVLISVHRPQAFGNKATPILL